MQSQRFYSAHGRLTCKLIVNLMSVWDPMCFARELQHAADYYPLGFPLRLCANSEAVLEAGEASWGGFPPAFSTDPLQVQVLVESLSDQSSPARPDYRGREHLFLINGGRDSAVCDHTRAFAFCRLADATARETSFVSYYYL